MTKPRPPVRPVVVVSPPSPPSRIVRTHNRKKRGTNTRQMTLERVPKNRRHRLTLQPTAHQTYFTLLTIIAVPRCRPSGRREAGVARGSSRTPDAAASASAASQRHIRSIANLFGKLRARGSRAVHFIHCVCTRVCGRVNMLVLL